MATYIEQSLAKLKEFEGCVPWMYRDTVGKVTVGVGLMLPDVAVAQALPFQCLGRAATTDEIGADFARVAAAVEGKAAEFYRGAGSPELGQGAIDTKLMAALEGFDGKLRAAMNGYDGFPDAVKLALLDMAFNLGPAGVLSGYPRMVAAVENGNWVQAAAECGRQGPSAARNAWTKEQFLAAVAVDIQAEAEGLLARIRLWLRGLWR